jgi:hypothetical protein
MNPNPASAPPLHNKSEHIPQQWKLRTPSHPIHRNNAESRLLLDIIIPHDKQAKGQAVVNWVNKLLHTSRIYGAWIDAILYSTKGRPIVITSEITKAEALGPHARLIYEGIFGEAPPAHLPLHTYPDQQQYRVKLNNVPTRDLQDHNLIHPERVLHCLGIKPEDLVCPAHWLTLANRPRKENGTIVIPFRSREEALQVHKHHNFLFLGELCCTSLYTDNPPKPRTSNNPQASLPPSQLLSPTVET